MNFENAQYIKSPITNQNENIRVTIDGVLSFIGIT